MLSRKFAIFLSGNAFRRLTDPAFTLDTSLTCIIEADILKFKSLAKLRSIIDMTEIYREATDAEVRRFAGHNSLHVSDIAEFLEISDQVIRKLVRAVIDSEVLDKYAVDVIEAAATETGLNLNIEKDRIVMPRERSDIKAILQFLDESRYSGPLSGQPYITNSRRPA